VALLAAAGKFWGAVDVRLRWLIRDLLSLSVFHNSDLNKSTTICKVGDLEVFPQSLLGFGNIYTSIKYTPMSCTPIRYTPIRSTAVRYTPHEVYAHEVYAYEVQAHEVQAHEVQACEAHTHKVHALWDTRL